MLPYFSQVRDSGRICKLQFFLFYCEDGGYIHMFHAQEERDTADLAEIEQRFDLKYGEV